MKFRLCAAGTVLTFLAHSAYADGLSDAKAGLEALNRGDNTAAISLFTKAITGGKLSRADKELAYVKRSEAYLATGSKDKALADANRALALDSGDSEAAGVRDKAQGATANGASLAVTMKFIQDKLNERGLVSYTETRQDNVRATAFGEMISGVVANASSCQLFYREKDLINGETVRDAELTKEDGYADYSVDLRKIRAVIAKTRKQMLDETPFFRSRNMEDNPEVFLIQLQGGQNHVDVLEFLDENMASRVTQALIHAVELCGGGNKDPF
jgi:tetratricopeptide (TPR) repeat protein